MHGCERLAASGCCVGASADARRAVLTRQHVWALLECMFSCAAWADAAWAEDDTWDREAYMLPSTSGSIGVVAPCSALTMAQAERIASLFFESPLAAGDAVMARARATSPAEPPVMRCQASRHENTPFPDVAYSFVQASEQPPCELEISPSSSPADSPGPEPPSTSVFLNRATGRVLPGLPAAAAAAPALLAELCRIGQLTAADDDAADGVDPEARAVAGLLPTHSRRAMAHIHAVVRMVVTDLALQAPRPAPAAPAPAPAPAPDASRAPPVPPAAPAPAPAAAPATAHVVTPRRRRDICEWQTLLRKHRTIAEDNRVEELWATLVDPEPSTADA
jgi:hypothetical protein